MLGVMARWPPWFPATTLRLWSRLREPATEDCLVLAHRNGASQAVGGLIKHTPLFLSQGTHQPAQFPHLGSAEPCTVRGGRRTTRS